MLGRIVSVSKRRYTGARHMKSSGIVSNFVPAMRALWERVCDLLVKTGATWKVIATERVSIAWVYRNHLLPLGLLSALAALLGWALVAAAEPETGTLSFPMALSCVLVLLVMVMVGVWVLAQGVDALAPHFGARKSELRAFKLMAYSVTPMLLLGLFALVPGAVWLCCLGLTAALWMIWQGLPRLMRCPENKRAIYFAPIAVACLVWALLTVTLLNAMQPSKSRVPAISTNLAITPAAPRASNPASAPRAVDGASVAASGASEIAETGAQSAASQAEVAMTSSEPAASVAISSADLERLATQIKALVPASLGGMPRDQLSAQPLSVGSVNGVAVHAGFAQGDKTLSVNLAYVGPNPKQTVLGEWANGSLQRDDATRSERIYADGARHFSEMGRKDGSSASLRVLLGNGLMIDMDAFGMPLEALKSALAELKLAELEQLKGMP